MGHPYCTASMSEPMMCCSSRGRDLIHSRTGSRPVPVLKNTTRNRNPLAMAVMYHSWCVSLRRARCTRHGGWRLGALRAPYIQGRHYRIRLSNFISIKSVCFSGGIFLRRLRDGTFCARLARRWLNERLSRYPPQSMEPADHLECERTLTMQNLRYSTFAAENFL
jgi:hypothetical protein